jgi:hypothetical protein
LPTLIILALTLNMACVCFAQTSEQAPAAADQGDSGHARIFGIIPNYRTSPPLNPYQPLSPRGKFSVAKDDAFDRGTFVLAALFAVEGQWKQATPAFGHGISGYSRYYAASLTDFVVGDFMTEGVYPTILHQDPRYFRRGTGTFLGRLGYAIGQIFWTHADSGGSTFNVSEIVGNATAVGLANAYYPDSRTWSGNATKLGEQVGVDLVGNILKEFSPDLDRAFSRRHHPSQAVTACSKGSSGSRRPAAGPCPP